MTQPIKTDDEALKVAVKIVDEQDKLLVAYRTGRAPAGRTIDYLMKNKPRLTEWRNKSNV